MNFIVLAPDELRAIVRESVAEALAAHTPATQPELMTVEEAADYLRCGVNRVYRLTCERKIPFVRQGRRVLFRKDELDDWLDVDLTSV